MAKDSKKKDDKADKASHTPAGLAGLDMDEMLKGMIDKKSPAQEAFETVGKALTGDKKAKKVVVDGAVEFLVEAEKEMDRAKKMGRQILKKFAAHRGR